MLLEPTVALEPHRLEQALLAVIEQHDALRLRFTEVAGQWQAEHQAVSDAPVLWQVRVPSMDKCAALFADAQRSLDLEQGPLMRALLVDGPEGQQRLFIAIHHLVVDGVSWRVLLDDLQTVYRQLDARAVGKTAGENQRLQGLGRTLAGVCRQRIPA